jgi:alpha-tubulin suppressor-like RCC1 family protein
MVTLHLNRWREHRHALGTLLPLLVASLSVGALWVGCTGAEPSANEQPAAAGAANDGALTDIGNEAAQADIEVPDAAPQCILGLGSGAWHTCAVGVDHSLKCWGRNSNGELGDGTTDNRSAPAAATGLPNRVVQVVGGYSHSCARTSDAALWCWGSNRKGQVGDGTTNTPKTTPAQVTALGSSVEDVSTGFLHTCALKSDGTLWCWGCTDSAQLGDGVVDKDAGVPSPKQVTALGTDVAEVRVGGRHSCARKTDGTLWCWGDNENGQIGDGSTGPPQTAPAQVTALATATARIAAGDQHTCALKNDGTLWCWGRNVEGQLGDRSNTDRADPVQITSLGSEVAEVTAGTWHTCARKTDGTLWCWGSNLIGELGNGSTADRNTPAQVAALGQDVRALACGERHSCAVKTDGTLWCWGSAMDGQLGTGKTDDSTVPVRAEFNCP